MPPALRHSGPLAKLSGWSASGAERNSDARQYGAASIRTIRFRYDGQRFVRLEKKGAPEPARSPHHSAGQNEAAHTVRPQPHGPIT